MRIEKDFLGEKQVDSNVLFGVHSLRAKENFPIDIPFHIEWYQALATVKKACYLTAKDFFLKISEKSETKNLHLLNIEPGLLDVLIESASECESGLHFEHFIVPAISGGAGTSINMNMNEIIANLSLIKTGHKPGQYQFIDPIEHANIFQSTNDVVPTALHLASMKHLLNLEETINACRSSVEENEKMYRNVLRLAYTQMQEAVPSTFGKLFSTYSDALSRDWWRISKCYERIKVVNLGGSAAGTSIAVPRYFVKEVVRTLQSLTELPITRAENLADATNNLDSLVEVSGILKAHAVNLEKIVSDLRLLSSDINSSKEIEIPRKQVGSSIMPGKINPVIPEFIISAAHKIYSNDLLITSLSAQGCLELNAYIPAIGHALLENLRLLIASNVSLSSHLLKALSVNKKASERKVYLSPSVTTALLPYIGYNNAGELARHMKEHKTTIFESNELLGIMDNTKLKNIMKPDNLIKEGFTLNDLLDNN